MRVIKKEILTGFTDKALEKLFMLAEGSLDPSVRDAALMEIRELKADVMSIVKAGREVDLAKVLCKLMKYLDRATLNKILEEIGIGEEYRGATLDMATRCRIIESE